VPALSVSDVVGHYTPSDPEAPLTSLLALADQLVAAKPGLRDEYMRAKSEEVCCGCRQCDCMCE
jgi:hypothetical protein